MSSIDNTINKLKYLINDTHCESMNISTIKGFLGELIVKQKLMLEKCGDVAHKGNQGPIDLVIDNRITIDVKCSSYKNEGAANKGFYY